MHTGPAADGLADKVGDGGAHAAEEEGLDAGAKVLGRGGDLGEWTDEGRRREGKWRERRASEEARR